MDSFSTKRNFKFRPKVAFYILGMCYTLTFAIPTPSLPHIFIFQANLSGPPYESFQSFQRSPLLGSQSRLCSPKNQVIPPIMTGPLAGKNGHRERIFSNTLSRVEICENGGFSFSNTMMSFIKNTSSHDACSIRYAIVFPFF